ncbi:dynamin-like protein LeoC [Chromobacterium amazonense]|uniref:dynamin-like protein LeoC n=1 Tax=Chromobacterium amazonense TaxID=1382803 RepID=UPI003F79E583
MNPKQDFNILYSDVSDSIATAMAEIATLKVEHKDGKQELSNIMEKLRGIQARFDDELAVLEQHAEWDKFTLAFFGETNAGKSTIIESLRILFQEESRQQLLQQNGHDLAQYEQELEDHVNLVRESMNKVYVEYVAEITAIKQSSTVLARVLQDESASRLQLAQSESSARMKRKLWLYAMGGFVAGGVVSAAIAMLVGS